MSGRLIGVPKPPPTSFWDNIQFPANGDVLRFDEKGGWPVNGLGDAKESVPSESERKLRLLEQKFEEDTQATERKHQLELDKLRQAAQIAQEQLERQRKKDEDDFRKFKLALESKEKAAKELAEIRKKELEEKTRLAESRMDVDIEQTESKRKQELESELRKLEQQADQFDEKMKLQWQMLKNKEAAEERRYQEQMREFDAKLDQKDREFAATLQERKRQFDEQLAIKNREIQLKDQQMQQSKAQFDQTAAIRIQELEAKVRAQEAKDEMLSESLSLKAKELKQREVLAEKKLKLEAEKQELLKDKQGAEKTKIEEEMEQKRLKLEAEYKSKSDQLALARKAADDRLNVAMATLEAKKAESKQKLSQSWAMFQEKSAAERKKLDRVLQADELKRAFEAKKMDMLTELQGIKLKEAKERSELQAKKNELDAQRLQQLQQLQLLKNEESVQKAENTKLQLQLTEQKIRTEMQRIEAEQRKLEQEMKRFDTEMELKYHRLNEEAEQFERQFDEKVRQFNVLQEEKKQNEMQRMSLEWKKVNNQAIVERKQHELAVARQAMENYKLELQERKQTDDADFQLQRFKADVEEKERQAELAIRRLDDAKEQQLMQFRLQEQKQQFDMQLKYADFASGQFKQLWDMKFAERKQALEERKVEFAESKAREDNLKGARQIVGNMLKDIHRVTSLATENKDVMSDSGVMDEDGTDFQGSLEEALGSFRLWFAALLEDTNASLKLMTAAVKVCDPRRNFTGSKASVAVRQMADFVSTELQNYRSGFVRAFNSSNVSKKPDADASMMDIISMFIAGTNGVGLDYMKDIEKRHMRVNQRLVVTQAVLRTVRTYLRYQMPTTQQLRPPAPNIPLVAPTSDKRLASTFGLGLTPPPGGSANVVPMITSGRSSATRRSRQSQKTAKTGPQGDAPTVEEKKGQPLPPPPPPPRPPVLSDIDVFLRRIYLESTQKLESRIRNMSLDDLLLVNNARAIESDLADVHRFLMETSNDTKDVLENFKGANTTGVILHVVELLLNGLKTEETKGMAWGANELAADLQKTIDPLIRQVNKRVTEERKAFETAQKSLDNIARFWNDYWPWMIIDTLTATWSEIYADIIAARASGQTEADILMKLVAYQAAIEDAFQKQRERDIQYHGGNEDVVMHEMKMEPRSRTTLQTVFKTINEWRRSVSNESQMAYKFSNNVLDFLRDLRPFLKLTDDNDQILANVVPPYIDDKSHCSQMLERYRLAFKDAQKTLQLTYKETLSVRRKLETTVLDTERPTLQGLFGTVEYINKQLAKLESHERQLDQYINEFVVTARRLIPVPRSELPHRARTPELVVYLTEVHRTIFLWVQTLGKRIYEITKTSLERSDKLAKSPVVSAELKVQLPELKDGRTDLERLAMLERVTATWEDAQAEQLNTLKNKTVVRLNKWRKILVSLSTSEIPDEKLVQNPLEYLEKAEEVTDKLVTRYTTTAIAYEMRKLKRTERKSNAADPDAGPQDPNRGALQLALSDHSRRNNLYKLLVFTRLISGAVPVTADYIVDLSVLLAGHSEVTEAKTLAQFADGQVSAENAGLRIFEAVANDLEPFEVDDNKIADMKKRKEEIQDSVARVSAQLHDRIQQYFILLEDARTFEEALANIMTPFAATAILAAWHMLQHSAYKLYGQRSLAQMICCASLPMRQIFARFCATQYNIVDKRRPTRHAHGIDFANEIALEQARLAEFLLRRVHLNPHVRSPLDMSQDPWLVVAKN